MHTILLAPGRYLQGPAALQALPAEAERLGRGVALMLDDFAARQLLPRLTALSVSFAVCQGCLFSFTVTWLVETRGMGLVQAGSIFAVMQVAGVVARIFLGWIADRTGHLSPGMIERYSRAARTLADLRMEPFPELAESIPDLRTQVDLAA